MTARRRLAAWIVLTVVLAGALSVVALGLSQPYAALRVWDSVRALGWLATVCLIAALAMSPLRRLARVQLLTALRRAFGIAAASCAAVHAAVALGALPGLAASVLSLAWLRAGLAALLLLVALLITSFDGVLRRLRLQHWKELHRLVYPATICVVIHAVLGPFGTPALELALIAGAAVLFMSRIVLAFVQKTPPSE
ncbi:MAG TPA: ferric reductase-like transmembrane domain-containing protein [Polyangiales bacterium]|nr:ferric reductase-like transmembrane domain-containing protein [Polyangiales bacterium]